MFFLWASVKKYGYTDTDCLENEFSDEEIVIYPGVCTQETKMASYISSCANDGTTITRTSFYSPNCQGITSIISFSIDNNKCALSTDEGENVS